MTLKIKKTDFEVRQAYNIVLNSMNIVIKCICYRIGISSLNFLLIGIR